MPAFADLVHELSALAPLQLSLPLAPVGPLRSVIAHLTSTPLHAHYFPYLRFGALHAARVCLVWEVLKRSARKGDKKASGSGPGSTDVGVLGDLVGYLTMAWGGGTVVPLLLGQSPSWLLSSTPWATYIPIYVLLVPTGMASYIVSTCPSALLTLIGALIDATTRGVTISSLPGTIATSSLGASGSGSASAWSTALLSAIAVTSGGILVQLLGLHQPAWAIGTPALLRGGILNTLDAWSAALAGVVYAALLGAHAELKPITVFLAQVLPAEVRTAASYKLGAGAGAGPLVAPDTARAIVVLLLAGLFIARGITLALLSPAPGRTGIKLDKAEREVLEAVTHEKAPLGVSAGQGQGQGQGQANGAAGKKGGSRASTPKKSNKPKAL